MEDTRLATITRSAKFSPGMELKDRAIIQAVINKLQLKGLDVDIIEDVEEIEESTLFNYNLILHMSRDEKTLQLLKSTNIKNKTVINSPTGVENCSRLSQVATFALNEIPQPNFSLLSTNNPLPKLQYPGWIKKAEGWSCHKDDVQYVTTQEEAQNALEKFEYRGTTQVIYTQHINGDIIKFYGVTDIFFYWYYPNINTGKYGLELINGEPKGYNFDTDELKNTIFKAAKTIGIEVYGGDCIIASNGKIDLIDFNDWPSFSPCIEEASEAITSLIIS